MKNILTENKKIFIKSYGCQMNVYDSMRMQELFEPMGYKFSDNYQDSDIVILNTCHIREKAADKVYSELGRINNYKNKSVDKKDMLIVVAGCVAQAEGDFMIERAPYIDIIVGPQSYHQLPYLVNKINNGEKINKINLKFIEEKKFDLLPQDRNNSSVAAFLSIQEGCDKFCSFCVVPFTRGAEFSRPVESIINEAKGLVDSGVKEITLLGQNVNAYHGLDRNGQITDLGQLIMILDKIEGLERIRYTTSHPRDMHDTLYEAHAISKKLMPFLHLPIQSGSNRILNLMNRKHTREEYISIIKKLRIARPDIAFSSDFIVGYPGETEEDFNYTLDLVSEVKFGQCYSFKYSIRPGTKAANLDNQISEEIKSQRLLRLQDVLAKQQLEFNNSFIDKKIEVLFDRHVKDQLIGRSPHLQAVCIDYNEKYFNSIIDVNITNSGPRSLNGIAVNG